jgi:hypothetical protein
MGQAWSGTRDPAIALERLRTHAIQADVLGPEDGRADNLDREIQWFKDFPQQTGAHQREFAHALCIRAGWRLREMIGTSAADRGSRKNQLDADLEAADQAVNWLIQSDAPSMTSKREAAQIRHQIRCLRGLADSL